MKTLHTNRLILRPFQVNDAGAMYKNWTTDERVAKYCRWHPHKSISETETYLKLCLDAKYSWAITLKGKDEPIGAIDVVGVNQFGVHEIGYVLSHDYWGQGIMTEAATAVIAELFRCGFDKIGSCHDVDNPASGEVMKKCGMTCVGSGMEQKKFGSDEQCEVRYYEITSPKVRR